MPQPNPLTIGEPRETYRGWTITQGRWPEPKYRALSPDYDASYEGEEDGWVDNGQKADADTYDALIAEIDEWFAENGQSNEIAGRLERAADLVEPKGAWIRGVEARNALGEDVSPLSEDAVCWCIAGAYARAGGEWGDHGWLVLRGTMKSGVGPMTWNDDEATQAEVVAKLREAGGKARESAQ